MKRPSIDKTKAGRLCTYAAVLFVLYLLHACSFSYLEIAAASCTVLFLLSSLRKPIGSGENTEYDCSGYSLC
jgi:hypothetical protein